MRQIPPVTKNLLIVNVICFLVQLVGEQRGLDLSESLGLHFFPADDFRPWQLVTYMFLHANFAHLFFNMFSLWMFGRIVEQTMSAKRFVIFYFVCGIGAGLCQELWQTGQYYVEGLDAYRWVTFADGTAPMAMSEFLNTWTTIGASGACYGVLLAFGMAFPNERIILLIPPIPMKAKYFVAGYAAVELLSAFVSSGNVAHFAHLGGMLFGLLLILHWRRRDRGPRGGFGGWETWTPRRSRSLGERFKDFWRSVTKRKPKMKAEEGGKRFKDRGADYDYNARMREEQERIDIILGKIRRSGYESLTEEEKQLLFKNSKR